MKKILVSLLFGLCLVMTACQEKAEESKEPENKVEENVVKEPEREKTEFNLVEGGSSSYKIVIPEESTEMISFAAEELQLFISEATGVTLEIVNDSVVDNSEYVISLGKTKVAEELAVVAAEDVDLGTSGYIIKTIGNSVAIVDDVNGDGEGVLYGVYDFLRDEIGFKVYAIDEIVYDEVDTVALYAYNDTVTPSFDERTLSYKDLRMNEDYMRRMRMFDLYTTDKWALYGHSQVSQILPYTEEHADWYCAGGRQLCWSAGEEMETAFANNLIEKIKAKPEATYFMLGQEDAVNVCSCETCLEAISKDKYGSYSGLQVVFLNHIIEKVEAWREVNAPDRELRYVCFAYQISLQPPVKQDASGNYVAYHEDCVPADELYILFAPIEADFSLPLEDDINKRALNSLVGWQSIATDRVLVYEYDTNFKSYFMNFNNFEVVQDHYDTYYENGVSFMYSQGPVEAYIPCFSEMRIFVESELMWDLSRDYDTLVNEFMEVYYKDAAPAMRKYYDFIRENYANLDEGGTGQIYAILDVPTIYSFETMEKMDAYIEEALEAIEPLRNTDNELFKELYYRVKKESLSSLWLKLNTFSLYYDEEQIEDIALEFYYLCKQYGIEQYKESHDISDMFYGFISE